MQKVITLDEAVEKIKPEMTIMVGGFLTVGTPPGLIHKIVERKIGQLHLITNDTGYPDKGAGLLIVHKLVKSLVACHIGTNPETGRQMIAKEIEVELVPQGTLIEQIRCGGNGLGGFLTPTGVGTLVAKDKQHITINGREYLLELPRHADVALIKAYKADTIGNLIYRRTARNFNPTMATAADLVIAEVDEIVEVGELDPELVHTPSVYVDFVCQTLS